MANKKVTPAATEKQREFGALLKEIRQNADLSRKKMGRMLGDVSIHSIICYEWTDPRFGCLLPSKQLWPYLELALKVGVDPVDVMNAYCEADNERRPWLCEKSPSYAQFVCASMPVPNLFDIAMSDPQFFLERVRWNPLRIQAAMDRLTFWSEYEDIPDVARHRKDIARDAKQMLDEYRQTGAIFHQFAHDLTGYEITRKVYYDGLPLKSVLEIVAKPYTRRWAQELMRRTFIIFQRRVRDKYDR